MKLDAACPYCDLPVVGTRRLVRDVPITTVAQALRTHQCSHCLTDVELEVVSDGEEFVADEQYLAFTECDHDGREFEDDDRPEVEDEGMIDYDDEDRAAYHAEQWDNHPFNPRNASNY